MAPHSRLWVTPNQVTALRVLMAFAAVALFGRNPYANGVALGFTVAAVALDALDGHLARRLKLSSLLGAQIDILSDRVIENVFFTYFAVRGLISIWVPLVFFLRGTLTDFVRNLADRAGRVGFGWSAPAGGPGRAMLETRWGRTLVASRASRGAYGALKCLSFCCLGLVLTLRALPGWDNGWARGLSTATQVIVSTTLAFCLLRGLPVLWEGRRYLGLRRDGDGRARTISGVSPRIAAG